MEWFKVDPQWFAEGGDAAGTAGSDGGGSEAAENDLPAAGETLADGTKVDAQLAAAIESQVKKHPELRKKYAGVRGQDKAPKAQPAENPEKDAKTGEDSRRQKWEELKKGEFADFFGQDMQKGIQDRFKNQKDANKQLKKLAPMLEVLRQRAGVESDDDLIKQIMDDDSLYEQEANERGMTIEALKEFKAMEKELTERKEAEKQSLEDRMLRQHFEKLVHQADELRQRIPDFDLRKELENPLFLQMTSKDVGVPVEAAYFAIHHDEMMPQAIAMGVRQGVMKAAESVKANGSRPAEGAMQGNTAAAPVAINPRQLTPKQIRDLISQANMGKRVTFD